MALKTAAEIKAMITALDAKIAKAEDQQSYTSGGPGQGMVVARGNLQAMYAERQRLWLEYDRAEALETGGSMNKVQFQRPQ